MKTRIGLLLPLVALAACADNNVSVEIAAVCAAPEDATNCVFSAGKCDMVNIGYNLIDLAATDHLLLMLQVNNQLPNNEALGDNRLNSNDAWVHEYEVQFDIGLPDSTGPILGSAWIPAAGSTVISMLPVNPTVALALNSLVPAGGSMDFVGHLRLRGVYGDTTEFETGVFDIPLRACKGCIGALVCAAGDLVACCPACGQSPASMACVTP